MGNIYYPWETFIIERELRQRPKIVDAISKNIFNFRRWVNKSVSLRKNRTLYILYSLLARPNNVMQDIYSQRGKKKSGI